MVVSSKQLTAGELKLKTGPWYLMLQNFFVAEAYRLVNERYEMGITDSDGRKLFYDFTKKLRSLRANQRPARIFDEFLAKMLQGDFLDYKRKDCETIRLIKNRQSTQKKRQLKKSR